MREKGYQSIELAKENGSWTFLDEVEAVLIPEDLKEAFKNYKGATKCTGLFQQKEKRQDKRKF